MASCSSTIVVNRGIVDHQEIILEQTTVDGNFWLLGEDGEAVLRNFTVISPASKLDMSACNKQLPEHF